MQNCKSLYRSASNHSQRFGLCHYVSNLKSLAVSCDAETEIFSKNTNAKYIVGSEVQIIDLELLPLYNSGIILTLESIVEYVNNTFDQLTPILQLDKDDLSQARLDPGFPEIVKPIVKPKSNLGSDIEDFFVPTEIQASHVLSGGAIFLTLTVSCLCFALYLKNNTFKKLINATLGSIASLLRLCFCIKCRADARQRSIINEEAKQIADKWLREALLRPSAPGQDDGAVLDTNNPLSRTAPGPGLAQQQTQSQVHNQPLPGPSTSALTQQQQNLPQNAQAASQSGVTTALVHGAGAAQPHLVTTGSVTATTTSTTSQGNGSQIQYNSHTGILSVKSSKQ